MKSSRLGAFSIWLTIVAALPVAAYAQDAPSSPSASTRPTVAVLDFDFAAAQERGIPIQGPLRGRAVAPAIDAMNVGKGIADLLVAELVNEGDLRVLERQRMAEVARERQGGGTVKARYLVMGALSMKENVANVDLSCRIVDAATGEIVATANGSGLSHRKGVAVGGFGGARGNMGGGGLNVASADFQATILGEATVAAVKEAAENLRAALVRLKADTAGF